MSVGSSLQWNQHTPGFWQLEPRTRAGGWAGGEGRVGAWEPLVSRVRSLRGASGLPRVSGCFWRLWEGSPGAPVLERSNPETSLPLRQQGKAGL